MQTYIFADRFFLPSGIEGPGYLEITDGLFGKIVTEKPEKDVEIIDYSGKWIAPGLVDTHVHGFKNHDVMDNDATGLNIISEGILSTGVTSFLPTTLTSDHTLLKQVSETIRKNQDKVTGAKIQGIFFEGPFFTEKHKGAQNPIYFSDPDLAEFHEWQEAAGGLIKKIALAPERGHVEDFVKAVTDEGVVVALGHSDATYAQAKSAVEAGASVFVHTYNGMSPLHHREPGMVGAAMSLRNVYAELICDGHHVNPVSAEILMNVRGRNQVLLITDCMMAGGMPDGPYKLGEFPVTVAEGTARLESGSLAGSILQLKDAIKNVVDWGIATPEEAIQMASYVPAVSSHIDNKCGSITSGRPADFIVLDKTMNLEATYLDGKCRYEVK